MSKPGLYIPLALFLVILAVFYMGFRLDERSALPSALLDKPFPEFAAPDLYQPQLIHQRASLLGRPALVNIWATWCPTCKAEHETFLRIAAQADVVLVGINYKDERVAALRWLSDFGNPYDIVISDPKGALGIELGVYGAPETFLINAEGTIVYKRVGDVNDRIWRDEIQPRLLAMENAG